MTPFAEAEAWFQLESAIGEYTYWHGGEVELGEPVYGAGNAETGEPVPHGYRPITASITCECASCGRWRHRSLSEELIRDMRLVLFHTSWCDACGTGERPWWTEDPQLSFFELLAEAYT